MEKPEIVYISEAILNFTTAAVKLKESQILQDNVILKANEIAIALLNKLEKCVDCLELDCCKKPCGCEDATGTNDCKDYNINHQILAFESYFANYYNPYYVIDLNSDLSKITQLQIEAFDVKGGQSVYNTSYYGNDAQNLFSSVGNNGQDYLGFNIMGALGYDAMLLNKNYSDVNLNMFQFVEYLKITLYTECFNICAEITLYNDDTSNPDLYMPGTNNYCEETEYTKNCQDEYFTNLGMKWNMSEDQQHNIDIVNNLSLEDLESLSKEVVYAMNIDVTTCISNYEDTWSSMINAATSSQDATNYWKTFLINVIQNS